MTITINQFGVLLFLAICILFVSTANLVVSFLSKKEQKPKQNISEIKEIMEAISGRNNRQFMPHEARRIMKEREDVEKK